MIRGLAQRVVDVDDARAGLAELALVDGADARVDRRGVELRQHEDLRGGVDAGAHRGDVPHAVGRLQLRAPLAQPGALRARVEQLARAVVKPVLAGSAAVPGLELASFGVQVGVVLADPVDDVALDSPGDAGEHVDEAVRVGRDEVDRRVARSELVHRGGDWQPPPACVAREPEVTAADQAEDDPALVALDRREVGVKGVAPGLAQPPPVVRRRPGGMHRLLAGEVHVLERAVQLVPLDLEGDQSGYEVVDVGARGDQDRERVLAVVVPAAPAGGGLDRLPAQDVVAEHRAEALWALAHDHAAAAVDRRRQAADCVQERAHVGLWLGGKRMQDRAHAEVRLHQRLDPDLAGALEHCRVRADVQLDGVPPRPTWRWDCGRRPFH